MNNFDYDLIVIGAGSGGTRTARIAAGYGAKTAVIEGDRPGGTCVLRGCVPKKLLIYGSEFSHQVEDAIGYGWETGGFKSNWKDLISKKNKELNRLHEIYFSFEEINPEKNIVSFSNISDIKKDKIVLVNIK